MSFIWSALGFILVMGILVTLHEAGHYFVARWLNIKATVFSVGFGRVIWKKQLGETEFRVCLLPLGGYVKFIDERNEDEVIDEVDLPRAFNRQPVHKRFLVVLAGPLVNIVFAWLAFSLMYFSGVPAVKPLFNEVESGSVLYQALSKEMRSVSSLKPSDSVTPDQAIRILSVDGQKVLSWQQVYQSILQALIAKHSDIKLELEIQQRILSVTLSLAELDINQPKQNWLSHLGFVPLRPQIPAVVDQVVSGSAAEKAGLKPLDQIISFNGQAIDDWWSLVSLVQQNPNKEVMLHFLRDQQLLSVPVLLGERQFDGSSQGVLGASVRFDQEFIAPLQTLVRYQRLDAFVAGYQHSLDIAVMSLKMLHRMLIGEVSVTNLSGPVSIAQYSGQALESGWIAFLSLLGLISLSLGILNLLPIPVLDGGHLMFYLIEMVKGIPLSESTQLAAQKIGMFLLLALTFMALFNDVVRITNE